MAKLSIGAAWDETKATFARDRRRIMPVALTLLLLPTALMVMVMGSESQTDASAMSVGVSLMVIVLALVTIVGNLAIARLALAEGDSVGSAIALAARRMWPLLGALLLVAIPFTAILFALLVAFGGEAAMTASAMSPTFDLLALILLVGAVYVMLRLVLGNVVSVAEDGSPVHILKRSFALSKGQTLRIAGFVAALLIAALIVSLAVGMAAGALVAFGTGKVEPMTLGALLLGLVQGAIQTGLALVYMLMLVAIYRQLARG